MKCKQCKHFDSKAGFCKITNAATTKNSFCMIDNEETFFDLKLRYKILRLFQRKARIRIQLEPKMTAK
jgi:hypothetical protein